MFRLTAEVEGMPLPKERQLEIIIDLLVAVQRGTADVTSAFFDRGAIRVAIELRRS